MKKVISLCWVYLWNPFISKFKALPPYCPNNVGLSFGYLAKIDDYKVIVFVYDHRRKPLPCFIRVHVYSLSTNSWKTIRNDNFSTFSFLFLPYSIVVNGAPYWLFTKDKYSMKGMLCFDIKENCKRLRCHQKML